MSLCNLSNLSGFCNHCAHFTAQTSESCARVCRFHTEHSLVSWFQVIWMQVHLGLTWLRSTKQHDKRRPALCHTCHVNCKNWIGNIDIYHIMHCKASASRIIGQSELSKVRQHKLWLPQIKCEGTEWKVMVSSVRRSDTVRLVAFGQKSWWLNLRRESCAYWLDLSARPSIALTVEIFTVSEEELYHPSTVSQMFEAFGFDHLVPTVNKTRHKLGQCISKCIQGVSICSDAVWQNQHFQSEADGENKAVIKSNYCVWI